jgi:6-phosphogluconolactonase/glucosamine-6-phosphate isomerase/deaminase
VEIVPLGIFVHSTREELVAALADEFTAKVRAHPARLVALPTGPISLGVYDRIVRRELDRVPTGSGGSVFPPFGFPDTPFVGIGERMRVSVLTGPPMRDLLVEAFVRPLSIDASHLVSFPEDPSSTTEECRRMDRFVDSFGGVGLFFAEIDDKGRIGLVDNGTGFQTRSQVATRADENEAHSLFGKPMPRPCGLSLGLQDVTDAEFCLVAAIGAETGALVRHALGGLVSEQYPCAALRFCRNGSLHVDVDAGRAIGEDLLRRFTLNESEKETMTQELPFIG